MSPPARTFTGPALWDIQVNGYAGLDFNGDPAQWTGQKFLEVAGMMRRRGVFAALPTFITSDVDSTIARARRYRQLVEADERLGRQFPLLHVEGPFISSAEGPRGAHPREHCLAPACCRDLIDRIQDACGGRVAIVTLAPELPGVIELIDRLARGGVVVALGHTQAGADDIARAVDAGATISTHLGNGSHQVLPRLDNYVQTQLAEDRLWASFVPDGHHMPFTTLKNFIRAKTLQRTILTTDCMAAAELPPGMHTFQGSMVEVSPAGRVQRPGELNLAGSALTLDVGVLNVARFCGLELGEAWELASVNPARLLGREPLEAITVNVTADGFVCH